MEEKIGNNNDYTVVEWCDEEEGDFEIIYYEE